MSLAGGAGVRAGRVCQTARLGAQLFTREPLRAPPDQTCIAAIGDAGLRTLNSLSDVILSHAHRALNLVQGVLALPYPSPMPEELQLNSGLGRSPQFRPFRQRAGRTMCR